MWFISYLYMFTSVLENRYLSVALQPVSKLPRSGGAGPDVNGPARRLGGRLILTDQKSYQCY